MAKLIADSSAVLVDGRVLAQHQAALVLIRSMTQDPDRQEVHWLDLACGRGQILTNIPSVITHHRRKKIHYRGFDISIDHVRSTERQAAGLFGSSRVEVCDLHRFESLLSDGESFDVVTLTNTIHEINAHDLAATLVAALCRVNREGFAFLYDMETLPDLELGAIPWTGEEVQRIIERMLLAIGLPETAVPDVAVWPHRSCTCWNLQLHRKHLPIEDLTPHRERLVAVASENIRALLEEKLLLAHSAIDAAATYGAETGDERHEVHRLLYDFWAIARALGLPVAGALGALRSLDDAKD